MPSAPPPRPAAPPRPPRPRPPPPPPPPPRPARAPERGRAQAVRVRQGGELLGLAHLAEGADALAIDEQGSDLLAARAHDRELGGNLLAQRLEGPQEDGESLALDRLAHEDDTQP